MRPLGSAGSARTARGAPLLVDRLVGPIPHMREADSSSRRAPVTSGANHSGMRPRSAPTPARRRRRECARVVSTTSPVSPMRCGTAVAGAAPLPDRRNSRSFSCAGERSGMSLCWGHRLESRSLDVVRILARPLRQPAVKLRHDRVRRDAVPAHREHVFVHLCVHLRIRDEVLPIKHHRHLRRRLRGGKRPVSPAPSPAQAETIRAPRTPKARAHTLIIAPGQ